MQGNPIGTALGTANLVSTLCYHWPTKGLERLDKKRAATVHYVNNPLCQQCTMTAPYEIRKQTLKANDNRALRQQPTMPTTHYDSTRTRSKNKRPSGSQLPPRFRVIK